MIQTWPKCQRQNIWIICTLHRKLWISIKLSWFGLFTPIIYPDGSRPFLVVAISKFQFSYPASRSINVDTHIAQTPDTNLLFFPRSLSSFFPRSSPAAELRRRKRLERQYAMEDKIREIKRKQQEVEDSKSSSSPKKRRFIMLAAGVGCLIGVLCVYLYARGF